YRPVQLSDRSDADFGDRLLALGVLRILTRADLTFDLHVRALGERRGVLTEFSPRDAAVPGRVALALAGFPVFPTALGGEGQDGERRLVPGGPDFGFFAEKSN